LRRTVCIITGRRRQMFYTVEGAVKATGLEKARILSALESGRMPGMRNLFGEWQIEDRDLRSAYPALTKSRPASAPRDGALEAGIAAIIERAGDTLRGEPDEAEDPGPPRLPPAPALAIRPGAFAAAGAFAAPAQQSLLDWRPPGHPEIRIDGAERLSPRPAQGTRAGLVLGAILGILGMGTILGWLSLERGAPPRAAPAIRSSAAVSDSNIAPVPEKPRSVQEKPRETAVRALDTDKLNKDKIASLIAGAPARRAEAVQAAPQRPARISAIAPHSTGSLPLATVDRAAGPQAKPTPFPETRPITVEGWTVLDVVGRTAVLEGPDGVRRVARGESVPGLGRVLTIVRWGGRWIVATSRGLVSTP
jgi:hypothetical protein